MHAEHAAFIAELVRAGGRLAVDPAPVNDSYGSSGRPCYWVSVPERRAITRRWLAAHKKLSDDEVVAVAESLLAGQSHEEKTLATLVLRYRASVRQAMGPADVDRWLDGLVGWAEVDSLCQNIFTVDDMLADWPAWKGLIDGFSTDANINKRRAALVLLTGPVHYSPDARFRDLAFAVIERVKAERPILITKAVSWLLRCLVDNHPDAVVAYLAANEASLPKIAIRETRTKLATGTKSGRARP